MKKILVTIDFNPEAANTLDDALKLVKNTQIPHKLVLINTYIVHQTDPSQVLSLNDELKKKSKQLLLDKVNEAKQKLNGADVTVESISQMGSWKNVILQLSQQEKFDLVVMAKESEKLESLSTLIKDIKCPLLISTHA